MPGTARVAIRPRVENINNKTHALDTSSPSLFACAHDRLQLRLCPLLHARVQCAGKHWEWVPWRRIASEEASQEICAKRAGLLNDELLHVVTDSMGVLREEREAEVVGSAYRVQSLLERRGTMHVTWDLGPRAQ